MWVDSCSVALGAVRAGIAANTASTAEGLRHALSPIVVDDRDAPRNFSVLFSSNRRSAHLLFWGGCVVARSFDPLRIVTSLLDHLGAHLPPPDGLAWIASLPYVHDGRAVLVPAPLKDDLRIVDRQLRSAGYTSVDSPRALVDLATGELVVNDLVEADPEGVARAVAGVVRRRPEPPVPHGRYPIERWVFVDYTGRWGPVTRASATRAAVLQILAGIERPDEELLAQVSRLFARVRATSMFPGYPAAAIDAVTGQSPRQA